MTYTPDQQEADRQFLIGVSYGISLVWDVTTKHVGTATKFCAECSWVPDDTKPEGWQDMTEDELIRYHQQDVIAQRRRGR